MAKNVRNIPGNNVQDPSTIANLQYNDAAGSSKVSEVGRHLLPFIYNNAGTISYTTNLTTILQVPKLGMGLAVYNTDTSVHSITLGETSSQAALSAGTTDTGGHVGIPCMPGAWTYIATAQQPWVIADNASLLVFLIDDNTLIVNQSMSQVMGY